MEIEIKILGLSFSTPHTISIRCTNKNQSIINCSFFGGVQELVSEDGTVYFHCYARGDNSTDGLIIAENHFYTDTDGKQVYSCIFNEGSKITITGNIFNLSLDHAIYSYGPESIITNNRFKKTRNSIIQVFAEGSIISQNIFDASDYEGYGCIQLAKASNSIISNNSFYCQTSVSKVPSDGGVVIAVRNLGSTQDLKNIKIINNTFKFPILGEAINIITPGNLYDIVIEGNILEGVGQDLLFSGGDYASTIKVFSTGNGTKHYRTIIKNNKIKDCMVEGISLANNCEALIEGNHITNTSWRLFVDKNDNNQTKQVIGPVIRFVGDSLYCRVINNIAEDTRNESRTSYFITSTVDGQDISAIDNIVTGLPVYQHFLRIKTGVNFRNRINGGEYSGIFTADKKVIAIPNSMAQANMGYKIRLLPLDAISVKQQASSCAYYAYPSYGNVVISTLPNPSVEGNPPTELDSEYIGGTFLYEIFR